MSTPLLPTAEQIAASRAKLWHQAGDPLLTVEGLRAWLSQAGLVLFAPRPQQLPSPAPSVVEAVLGTPNPAITIAEAEQARTLAMRLVAEGSAVPLNLLGLQGTTGDSPDFLCSAQVFSYIFTLRGDKGWKQPPATIGAVKVSPLGLATYEMLAARVTMSAGDLATELGKEVTEAAVLRALNELWSQLRVLPVPQQDGTVLWELMSTRFTKQIKAGANAGQPKAVSALVSLYLGMVVAASEEEIETMLSPLAARSRIRDIVHALMGARQLETIAIGGRSVLHVGGDLPSFASLAPEGEAPAEAAADAAAEDTIEVEAVSAPVGEDAEPVSRITKFVPRPRKIGTGPTKSFNPRPGAPNDRERRPFGKKPFEPGQTSFTKPWNEGGTGDGGPATRAEGSSGARPGRPTFGAKPAFSRDEGGTRPTFRRNAPPRSGEGAGAGSSERPPRKTFSKPGTFGRKREQDGGRGASGEGENRPPRREFSSRPPAPNAGPRTSSGGDRPDRPQRSFEDRPSPARERRPGSYTPRPAANGEGFAGRKPYTPRTPREGEGSFPARRPFASSGKPFGQAPASRESGSGTEAPRKVFRKFDAPRFDKPRGPRVEGGTDEGPKKTYGAASSKPGGFAGKTPFARPGSKPPGTFAKFADGNKPFRKPGAGGKKFGGKPAGPTGAYRKRRPEEGGA